MCVCLLCEIFIILRRNEGINRRLKGQRHLEEKDKIMLKWAQKDVETSNNLLNKINKYIYRGRERERESRSAVLPVILVTF